MSANIRPNDDRAGRAFLIEGTFGRIEGELYHAYNGDLFDASGNKVGAATLEIRDPDNAVAPADAGSTGKKFLGPGDVMKSVLENIYNIEQTGCRCKKIQSWMNSKGWLWCLRNKAEVFEKVAESARERNIFIDPGSLWSMHRQLRRQLRKG